MTNPKDPATFTEISDVSLKTEMTLYNVDMKKYNPSYGQYFAIRSIGQTFYVDDFKYVDPTLAVHENQLKIFKLYPNHAKHVLNIDGGKNTIDLVTIYDLNGKEVKKIVPKGNPSLQIQIGNLSNGMYILEAHSGDRKEIQKFIKN